MTEQEKEMRDIAEYIRLLKRASQGLTLDDDFFQGLIQIRDLRERTNLTRRDVFQEDYKIALAFYGGDEWSQMLQWAKSEMHLFISVESARVMAFIQTLTRKLEQPGQVTQVTVPQTPTPPPQEEKKKGFWHK